MTMLTNLMIFDIFVCLVGIGFNGWSLFDAWRASQYWSDGLMERRDRVRRANMMRVRREMLRLFIQVSLIVGVFMQLALMGPAPYPTYPAAFTVVLLIFSEVSILSATISIWERFDAHALAEMDAYTSNGGLPAAGSRRTDVQPSERADGPPGA